MLPRFDILKTKPGEVITRESSNWSQELTGAGLLDIADVDSVAVELTAIKY